MDCGIILMFNENKVYRSNRLLPKFGNTNRGFLGESLLRIELEAKTKNLFISKSLNELVQAAIYKHLPDMEHIGFSSPSGKKFKSTVFRAFYKDTKIYIYFSSLDKRHEEILAKAVLGGEFVIGAVHTARSAVSVELDRIADEEIEVEGFVCAYIKDQHSKRLYLEPRDSRFIEVITKNLIEKYETLLSEKYRDKLIIETIWQSYKSTYIRYKKASHKTNKAIFKICAPIYMLDFISSTGMGSKIMQGCGMVEIVNKEAKDG